MSTSDAAAIPSSEREFVRALARQVREIAVQDEMRRRRELWIRHNDLIGDRPLILCFPEGAWGELLPESELRCTHPVLRGWEMQLRRRLYWWEHIRDDAAIEPFLDLYWHIDTGNYGVDVPMVWGDNRGSYVWDPPLKDLERDFDQLKPRTFTVDRAATLRDMELARNLLGDILPPRLRGSPWWTMGLTMTAAYLVGMEQLMLAMVDQPHAVHRLMTFLRDDMLSYMTWAESEGLLTPHNEDDYVGSGGLAYTRDLAGQEHFGVRRVHLSDLWGFAESQETVGISPMMFEEFVLPYQVPLLTKFGLNCYGCCEGLERRIDVVLRNVPRLRRVSVAPKADQARLAEKLAGRYIFSRKADPVLVCLKADEAQIRADLRRTLELAGRQPLEIILKDTHTVEGDPTRITDWVRMAREEVARYLDRRD